jgi:hypothetical protein
MQECEVGRPSHQIVPEFISWSLLPENRLYSPIHINFRLHAIEEVEVKAGGQEVTDATLDRKSITKAVLSELTSTP